MRRLLEQTDGPALGSAQEYVPVLGRRGARLARREEGAYRRYSTDEQRRLSGWTGVRKWVVILARALRAELDCEGLCGARLQPCLAGLKACATGCEPRRALGPCYDSPFEQSLCLVPQAEYRTRTPGSSAGKSFVFRLTSTRVTREQRDSSRRHRTHQPGCRIRDSARVSAGRLTSRCARKTGLFGTTRGNANRPGGWRCKALATGAVRAVVP